MAPTVTPGRKCVGLAAIFFSLCLGSEGAAASAPPGRTLLYVDNTAGDDITIVDTALNRVVGNIGVGPAPHGLGASPDGTWLYVSSEGRDELLAIETVTATVAWRRPLGGRPNEISVSGDGHFVYVPIRSADFVEVIDTAARRSIARIPVGPRPHNSYRSPDGRWIYATSMGLESIAVIDTATQKAVGSIALPGEPRPAAISPDNRFLYVQLTGLHGFVVADVAARKVIERVELPAADAAAVSAFGYTPSHGIGCRPGSSELWATNVYGNSVEAFSLPDHRLRATVPVGGAPNWLDFSPDGKFVYVSNPATNDVSVIDAERRLEVTRIPVGLGPKRVVVVRVPGDAHAFDNPGWKAAAARPTSTDYLLKGGGLIAGDAASFEPAQTAAGASLASLPARYRRLGIPALELDDRRLRGDADGFERFREALHAEKRTVAALDFDFQAAGVDAEKNQQAVDEAKECLERARALGAPIVCLRLRGAKALASSDAVNGIALAVRQLLPRAREVGIRLAVEAETATVGSADAVLAIVRATDPAWVGSGLNFEPGESQETARAAAEKLGAAAIHVRVGCRAFDRFGNESSIDYAYALPLVARFGYGSALSIRFDGPGDVADAMAKMRDLLVKLWIGKGIAAREATK